jgi:hypothetical protein
LTLFIDDRKLGYVVDHTGRELDKGDAAEAPDASYRSLLFM